MKRNHYQNRRTMEKTTSTRIALEWVKKGDNISIEKVNANGCVINGAFVHGLPQQPKRDENLEQCISISDELGKYVDGIVHTCPDCQSKIEIPETVGDKFKCPCCGEIHEIEDFEQLSLYDYFDGDVLDIDFTVNYQKEYKAVRICVAWGGPSIYIDTLSGNVELYWWTERASYRMRSDVIDALDEWAEEYYNAI